MRYFLYRLMAVLSCLLPAITAGAQPWFQRIDTIPVADASNNPLRNAWAGGLNFCQLSQVDLNMDGIKDLFVFDRTGSRITTFITSTPSCIMTGSLN
jgi:hypothetical protein